MACGPPYCQGSGGSCGCVNCRCCPPSGCYDKIVIPYKCSGNLTQNITPDPSPPETNPDICCGRKDSSFNFCEKSNPLDPCSEPLCPPYDNPIPYDPSYPNYNWYTSQISQECNGRLGGGSGYAANFLAKIKKKFIKNTKNNLENENYVFNATKLIALAPLTPEEINENIGLCLNATYQAFDLLIEIKEYQANSLSYNVAVNQYASNSLTGFNNSDFIAESSWATASGTALNSQISIANLIKSKLDLLANTVIDCGNYASIVGNSLGNNNILDVAQGAITAGNNLLASSNNIVAYIVAAQLAADTVNATPTAINALAAGTASDDLQGIIDLGIDDGNSGGNTGGNTGGVTSSETNCLPDYCYAPCETKNAEITFTGCCLLFCPPYTVGGADINLRFYAQGDGQINVTLPDPSPCEGEFFCRINGIVTNSLYVNSCDSIGVDIDARFKHSCCRCCVQEAIFTPHVANFMNENAYYTRSKELLTKQNVKKNIRQIKL